MLDRTMWVRMCCSNPECSEVFTAQIEHTPEGIFFLDETDHCPTCGQPGERDD